MTNNPEKYSNSDFTESLERLNEAFRVVIGLAHTAKDISLMVCRAKDKIKVGRLIKSPSKTDFTLNVAQP